MPAYTTAADVASYMGIDVGDLPSNINKLISDAQSLIDYAVLNKIQDYYIDQDLDEFTDSTIETRVMAATNAQVEYWITTSSTIDIVGSIPEFRIGNFQMKYGSSTKGGSSEQPILSPRARRELLLSGLLYRGIGRW